MHLPKCLFQKLSNGKVSMTRHSSYGKSGKVSKKRNVMKRFERIAVLKQLGRWEDGVNTKVTGLPKTPVLP
jgi:small basic protein (TIGR04137 family)